MTGCGCEIEIKDNKQKKTLVILLSINAIMFIVEMSAGLLANSTGLIADAIDMLADAMVYVIALYAVGRSINAKAGAALISGIFQIVLGLAVAGDIIRRLLFGSEPESMLMIAFGLLALIANTVCLSLIAKHRRDEVHMRASWIFSKNDIIANLGVIIGGVAVMFSGSAWPDLIIGGLITLLIIRGGTLIIKDARQTLHANN